MLLLRLIWAVVRAPFGLLMPVDPARKHHHHKLSRRAPRFQLHGCHIISNNDHKPDGGASSNR